MSLENKLDVSVTADSFVVHVPAEANDHSLSRGSSELRRRAFCALQKLGVHEAKHNSYPHVMFHLRRVASNAQETAIRFHGAGAEKLAKQLLEQKAAVRKDDARMTAIVGPLFGRNESELTTIIHDRFHIPSAVCKIHFDSETGVPRGSARVTVSASHLHRLRQIHYLSPDDEAHNRKTNVRVRIPPKNKNCLKCFTVGHLTSDCKSPSKCGQCGNEGHFASVCKSDRSPCLLCKSTDHISLQCPTSRWTLLPPLAVVRAPRPAEDKKLSNGAPRSYAQVAAPLNVAGDGKADANVANANVALTAAVTGLTSEISSLKQFVLSLAQKVGALEQKHGLASSGDALASEIAAVRVDLNACLSKLNLLPALAAGSAASPSLPAASPSLPTVARPLPAGSDSSAQPLTLPVAPSPPAVHSPDPAVQKLPQNPTASGNSSSPKSQPKSKGKSNPKSEAKAESVSLTPHSAPKPTDRASRSRSRARKTTGDGEQ